MNQKTVLSVVGCSGSLALAIALASPAVARPTAQPEADGLRSTGIAAIAAPTGSTLRDVLGCSCATCQASQRQPMI